MKTTYKILYYTGPIHILQRWCQELPAYNVSCIHHSHLMMIDVDYLSRINNKLIKTHVSIANRLSLTDRALRPEAYDVAVLTHILSKGKYSVKPQSKKAYTNHMSIQHILYIDKRARFNDTYCLATFCSIPIQISGTPTAMTVNKCITILDDTVTHCQNLQACHWLSVSRPPSLFQGVENTCVTQILQHYKINLYRDHTIYSPIRFCSCIQQYTSHHHSSVIDYFIPLTADSLMYTAANHIQHHHLIIKDILTSFEPLVTLLVVPLMQQKSVS